MSRSGYSDDCDQWALIRWRGAVKSGIRGARGQAMLRDLLQALDDLPTHRLIADSLVESGEFCALGALGRARGIDMQKVDPEDIEDVGQTFGISRALAAEIMYKNDECGMFWTDDTPEQRWSRMRDWVSGEIRRKR